jgi:hypothetical protein
VRIGFSASAHDIIASASEPAPVIGRGWLFAGMRIDTGSEILQAGQAVLGR